MKSFKFCIAFNRFLKFRGVVGVRTGLIGSYESVAIKIQELQAIGIDTILLTFRNALEELPDFYNNVNNRLESEFIKK
ncbi:hypothetical protein [Peribacillus sp. NPDC058076]|uniref:hypothetical protein n=1 Tax=Peribacillus sp. NPDC058076 TaxID=3346329 RepID=UPI003347D846